MADDLAAPLSYNEHAKQCDPKDFLAQMRRTVNGKQVEPEQIALIQETIVRALEIKPNDILLDLCCGNGALGDPIFDLCAGGVGVDIGDYLTEIANENFASPPQRRYICSDAASYVRSESEPGRFTKALCYGSFAYLSFEDARSTLEGIRRRFSSVSRFFIGNLPDKERMTAFFYEGSYVAGIENQHDSSIGIWRSEDEFTTLARSAGWDATFSRMPDSFFAAHYRYDVLLTPLS